MTSLRCFDRDRSVADCATAPPRLTLHHENRTRHRAHRIADRRSGARQHAFRLIGGKALTAGELAREAGVTAQTASSHLAKLADGGLIAGIRQGRHRYFRLAGSDVAEMLEKMMGVAERAGHTRTRTGPRAPELRKARVCYDHLAGEMGVALFDHLTRRKHARL